METGRECTFFSEEGCESNQLIISISGGAIAWDFQCFSGCRQVETPENLAEAVKKIIAAVNDNRLAEIWQTLLGLRSEERHPADNVLRLKKLDWPIVVAEALETMKVIVVPGEPEPVINGRIVPGNTPPDAA